MVRKIPLENWVAGAGGGVLPGVGSLWRSKGCGCSSKRFQPWAPCRAHTPQRTLIFQGESEHCSLLVVHSLASRTRRRKPGECAGTTAAKVRRCPTWPHPQLFGPGRSMVGMGGSLFGFVASSISSGFAGGLVSPISDGRCNSVASPGPSLGAPFGKVPVCPKNVGTLGRLGP